MTAPSVKPRSQLHDALVVPVAASHACTSPSSSDSTTVGDVARPTNPVLVKLAWRFLPEAGSELLGSSRVMTRNTCCDSSMTMYSEAASGLMYPVFADFASG